MPLTSDDVLRLIGRLVADAEELRLELMRLQLEIQALKEKIETERAHSQIQPE